MVDMNGVVKEIMGNGAQVGDPAVIRTLEEALALARAGKVCGVAVLTALGGDRVNIGMAGSGLGALACGAMQAQRMLLDQQFAPQQGGRLLMPGRG